MYAAECQRVRWEKYGPSNPEVFQSFDALSPYFEGTGVLVRKGLLDPSSVADLAQRSCRISGRSIGS